MIHCLMVLCMQFLDTFACLYWHRLVLRERIARSCEIAMAFKSLLVERTVVERMSFVLPKLISPSMFVLQISWAVL